MPKFTVHMLTSYCTWEDVEAKDEDEAISKCPIPGEFDCNDPCHFIAIEDKEPVDSVLLKEIEELREGNPDKVFRIAYCNDVDRDVVQEKCSDGWFCLHDDKD